MLNRLIVIFSSLLFGLFLFGQSSAQEKSSEDRKTAKTADESNDRKLNHWGQWRGPIFNGVAVKGNPPIEWGENKNVRWKIELPGRGHSTPIVWDKSIFLTTGIPVGEKFEPFHSGRPGRHDNLMVSQKHKFVLICVDRETGKIRWQKVLREAVPHEGGHFTASLASASAATDGEHVFAFFGSHGLFCVDFEGNLIWKKQLGKMHTKHGHGEGATIVLHQDKLFANWDHQEESFVVAFNKKTGKEVWRKKRDEITSWSSPIVIEHDGQAQLIVNGTNRIRAYDVENGKVVWACGGLSANIVASPVFSDGVVIAGSSYEKRAMMGILVQGAEGDITGTKKVAWRNNYLTPYVPSLLLYKNQLYFLRHYQGIMSRLDAKTGEAYGPPIRLQGFREIYASPVAAADRIYVTDREGTTVVLSHKDWPKVLATNQLDDRINASAAIVDNELYLRGEKYLYRIEETKNKPAR